MWKVYTWAGESGKQCPVRLHTGSAIHSSDALFGIGRRRNADEVASGKVPCSALAME